MIAFSFFNQAAEQTSFVLFKQTYIKLCLFSTIRHNISNLRKHREVSDSLKYQWICE